jgi:hypothetical protein
VRACAHPFSLKSKNKTKGLKKKVLKLEKDENISKNEKASPVLHSERNKQTDVSPP